jgi:hypothetical protein
MEEAFKQIALSVAFAAEAAEVLIIAFGTLQAVFGLVKYGVSPKRIAGTRKTIWLSLGDCCWGWNLNWPRISYAA